MTRAIAEATQKQNFDVVICDFLAPAVNLPAKLQTPVVLFQHNVEAEIWRRHYEVQTNAIKKRYLYWQWRKMQKFERAACRRVERVIAVSEIDAEMMQRDYGLSNVYDIPTGVDVDFFKPSSIMFDAAEQSCLYRFNGLAAKRRRDALFHQRDHAGWCRQAVPDLRLTIVGRDPYATLLELAQRDTAIKVTGRVDDVRPYIEEATAYHRPDQNRRRHALEDLRSDGDGKTNHLDHSRSRRT